MRESYRDESGRSRTRNILNLKDWDPLLVDLLEESLESLRRKKSEERKDGKRKDGSAAPGKKERGSGERYCLDAMVFKQDKSFGAAFAVAEVCRLLGVARVLGTDDEGKLALWQVAVRLLEQGSRLSAVRAGEMLELAGVLGSRKGCTENVLYDNLAWLAERQSRMERELFSERYPDGSAPSLFLYDVTSSYLEGVENEFADWGYNRDKKKGKMQIVVGLLCDEKGMPVSVEVFEGNTSDPKTVGSQIEKAAKRFGCGRVTFVGDRGMLKSDPLEALASEGFSYITGITKAQISKLLREGHLQLGLFDDDLKEVRVGDVRYVFRRNPVRREETEEMRTGKRKSVEETVDRMNAYLSEHPKAKTETALKRVRAKIEKLKTGSWLSAEAEGPVVKLAVDGKALAEEEILDGCYVLKTDLPESAADKETVNARYKSLYHVERAFRSCKSLLELRPIHVRKKESTRGHVFVVMLAYMVRRELERAWRDLNVTVEEGLVHLKTLCVLKMKLPGGKEVRRIPEPGEMCSKLLDALGVTLPDTVPASSAHVRTYKSLKKEA